MIIRRLTLSSFGLPVSPGVTAWPTSGRMGVRMSWACVGTMEYAVLIEPLIGSGARTADSALELVLLPLGALVCRKIWSSVLRFWGRGQALRRLRS